MGPNPPGVLELQNLFTKIIGLSVGVAFIALVIMLTVAGVRYVLSGGEPKGIQGAAGTITWALLGMLVLVVVWIILRLVQTFTGIDVTHFCIGFRPYCAL